MTFQANKMYAKTEDVLLRASEPENLTELAAGTST